MARTSLFTLLVALWLPSLWAGEVFNIYEELYTQGSGSVMLNYQYVDVKKFQNGKDVVDIPKVTTQSLYLEVDYAVADRWRIEVGIPYIKKRAFPPSPHNPLALDPPRPDIPFIDDGKYRGGVQDFYFGVEYLWITNPVRLEPFIHVSIPSHDYQFFANSALGQNLWKVEIGMELTRFLPFSDWYSRLGGGYEFAEQTMDVNVNHFHFNGEVGYFFTPTFSLNVFGIAKVGNGQNAQVFRLRPVPRTSGFITTRR